MTTARSEIDAGERFAFGMNWRAFLSMLDEDRIEIAVDSLKQLLQVDTLTGKTFLDVGCGSGLFSLAAHRLGTTVTSFDFDSDSVHCCEELHRRYAAESSNWTISQGSVLNSDWLSALGQHDVVYSWGVLHHTGEMWRALENVSPLVKENGRLAIAIYNDQGLRSRFWLHVKQIYCAHAFGRWAMTAVFFPYFFARAIAASAVRGHNEFARYRRHRGMSITHDWVDWLGGLPFEVASVDAIEAFYVERGFECANLKATRGLGCNEFMFLRKRSEQPSMPSHEEPIR